MYSAIVRLVGLASIVACLIVIASFGMFAVNQTSQASNQQTRTLRGEVPAEASAPTPQKAAKPHKGTVRQTIDDAAEWLTSPFDGLTSGSNSEWANHGIDLGLALVIYGFGIGFLARTLRVRV